MPLFRKKQKGNRPKPEKRNENPVLGRELFCLCETEEEALSIAKQYGIELVDWKDRVGVFHTDQDLKDLIEEGMRRELPRLSVNSYKKLAE